ncbi:MAG TPA: aspartate kinase [Atribacteraceae bacterium]|nr:aspartate kinase [Atribacteraceae bacterium]
MKIVVQKFGGTSVHTPQLRHKAALKVKEAIDEGLHAVVVVSAMGRSGAPYATDTLISLAREEHEELDARNLDLLLSCGEIISAVIMAQSLGRAGLRAVVLSGGQAGIITDAEYGDASILRVSPEQVRKHLADGAVVVVAGFQGTTETGDITTLGRGGSDTSAVALGMALEAEYVDIFTDVVGVMTADPRIVPEAQTIKGLTYTEAMEIIQHGAKVIHDKAMSVVQEYRIPLRVRSLDDEGKGTLICDIRTLAREGLRLTIRERPVYSIAYRKDLAQIRSLLRGGREEGLKIFQILARQGISIDLISLFPESVAFAVPASRGEQVLKILEDESVSVSLTYPCAKVSLVGSGMAGRPGVMALLMEALEEIGVEILQTGDSHITISCLLRAQDMERAIQVLHQKFELDHFC